MSHAFRRILLALAILIITAPGAVPAQERPRFGRSMGVRGLPIRIFYDNGQERVARKIADICESSIPGIAEQLGLGTVSPFQIQVAGSLEDYRGGSMNDLPEWGVAFAFMESQVMLIDARRATKAWNSLEKVVPHELSHLLLAQRIGVKPVPLWFIEGLAQWQAGQWSMLDSWQLMEAVWTGGTPWLGRIQGRFPRTEDQARDAYRTSYSAFTFRFGKEFDRLPEFLEEVRRADGFEEAFFTYWNENLADYYVRFQHDLKRRYSSWQMLFSSGPLFTAGALLIILLYVRLRIRNRRKLKQMEMAERGLSLDD